MNSRQLYTIIRNRAMLEARRARDTRMPARYVSEQIEIARAASRQLIRLSRRAAA